MSVEGGDLEFSRYMINVAADVPPDEVLLQPWAAELFQQRLESGGTEDPVAHCKPTGMPLMNALPVPFKIVQTPELVVVLYEENTVFRQIFLDGRKPVEDIRSRKRSAIRRAGGKGASSSSTRSASATGIGSTRWVIR